MMMPRNFGFDRTALIEGFAPGGGSLPEVM